MKKYQTVESRASSVERRTDNAARSHRVSRFTFHASTLNPHPVELQPVFHGAKPSTGFTLIELLVVIAIMAALAALLLPVAGAVKKHQYIYNAQAEMAKLETAIDRYKSACGFYPPDSHLATPDPLRNQLYYELTGTGYDPNQILYTNLDGSSSLTAANVGTAFGVGGFMNCTKPGGGDEASVAKNFLPDLKPNQMGTTTSHGVPVTILITADGGPDVTYMPLGQSGINPWRYNSSNPTNNPGSYDLWVQLRISGKTNLICNWSKQVQTDSPLP